MSWDRKVPQLSEASTRDREGHGRAPLEHRPGRGLVADHDPGFKVAAALESHQPGTEPFAQELSRILAPHANQIGHPNTPWYPAPGHGSASIVLRFRNRSVASEPQSPLGGVRST